VMIRVASTCLGSLRPFALIMAFRDSTVLGIAPSRMASLKGLTGRWRKASYPCCMSLGCLRHSGEKLWDHLSMYTTEHSHPPCRTAHPMKHSMGASLTSLCCAFGAVLLMSWFRRTRGLLGVLDRTWRSAFSLDTLQDTKLGSFTVQRARRCLFQKELTLMNAFSSIRGILHLKSNPLVLNLS